MNILITGGAGFIGSHLCEKLLNKNNKIICFDNLSTGSLNKIKPILKNKNFLFIKGNCNTKDIEKIFKKRKIDIVFHYAATVGVKRTIENPFNVIKDVEGIQRILFCCKKKKTHKIIFASSSEIYGEPIKLPEKEDSHIDANTPYAAVKLIGEKYLEVYNKKFGIESCALRMFNVYGPKQISSKYGFVVGMFIRQALENKKITVIGKGLQTRDFVYIDDHVNAAIRAMDISNKKYEVINIGTGKAVTILSLAKKVLKLTKKIQTSIKFIPNRKHEILHRNPDIKKMKKILKFTPKYSLDNGLKKTIYWYKKYCLKKSK